ncbi:MAG: type II toxin-antitoxin system HicB family antitoxin [Chloroflexi bacterium]|nr:type II toxin-antitoxin system HicB family antitoxin [Chloroflexota bacterium]
MNEPFQVIYRWATFQFSHAADGGYDVDVPAISNCFSSGATFEEALDNILGTLMARLLQDYRSGMAIAEELLPLLDTLVEAGKTQYDGG